MNKPVPIFVLGLQRSGTTWVANMLAGSGAVSAVHAPEHRGVHESIFFSHFARAFGPFESPAAKADFQVAFEQSDYFQLTGLSAGFLDQAIEQSTDFEEVFHRVMDAVCAKEDTGFWVEKSPHHSVLAEGLAARFPNARFLCCIRRSETLIASRLAAYGRKPSTGIKRMLDILRGSIANTYFDRRLTRFANDCPRAEVLLYDDFAAQPERGKTAVISFLDLPVSPSDLVSAYGANTSHTGTSKTRQLSALDLVWLRIGNLVGRLLPLGLLSRIEEKRRAKKALTWPEWVWTKTGYQPPAR